tara:strand:- start:417 stop:623 length:207 start_codon:yes stop_codon:yes gene_type:complete
VTKLEKSGVFAIKMAVEINVLIVFILCGQENYQEIPLGIIQSGIGNIYWSYYPEFLRECIFPFLRTYS